MTEAESYNLNLASKRVIVFKNNQIREATILQCHYDISNDEIEPSEKILVEYLDDHSKEVVFANEYTFVFKFALQRVIEQTRKQIKELQAQLALFEKQMMEAGGPVQCFIVGPNNNLPNCWGFYLVEKSKACFDCRCNAECAAHTSWCVSLRAQRPCP